MHNRSIHSTNYHCQCFPNYQNRQLHPTIIEVADFQRLLLFYNSLVTYIGHHFTFKFI